MAVKDSQHLVDPEYIYNLIWDLRHCQELSNDQFDFLEHILLQLLEPDPRLKKVKVDEKTQWVADRRGGYFRKQPVFNYQYICKDCNEPGFERDRLAGRRRETCDNCRRKANRDRVAEHRGNKVKNKFKKAHQARSKTTRPA